LITKKLCGITDSCKEVDIIAVLVDETLYPDRDLHAPIASAAAAHYQGQFLNYMP
jgi:hypothetical protein